jgi:hypothetical protein
VTVPKPGVLPAAVPATPASAGCPPAMGLAGPAFGSVGFRPNRPVNELSRRWSRSARIRAMRSATLPRGGAPPRRPDVRPRQHRVDRQRPRCPPRQGATVAVCSFRGCQVDWAVRAAHAPPDPQQPARPQRVADSPRATSQWATRPRQQGHSAGRECGAAARPRQVVPLRQLVALREQAARWGERVPADGLSPQLCPGCLAGHQGCAREATESELDSREARSPPGSLPALHQSDSLPADWDQAD